MCLFKQIQFLLFNLNIVDKFTTDGTVNKDFHKISQEKGKSRHIIDRCHIYVT